MKQWLARPPPPGEARPAEPTMADSWVAGAPPPPAGGGGPPPGVPGGPPPGAVSPPPPVLQPPPKKKKKKEKKEKKEKREKKEKKRPKSPASLQSPPAAVPDPPRSPAAPTAAGDQWRPPGGTQLAMPSVPAAAAAGQQPLAVLGYDTAGESSVISLTLSLSIPIETPTRGRGECSRMTELAPAGTTRPETAGSTPSTPTRTGPSTPARPRRLPRSRARRPGRRTRSRRRGAGAGTLLQAPHAEALVFGRVAAGQRKERHSLSAYLSLFSSPRLLAVSSLHLTCCVPHARSDGDGVSTRDEMAAGLASTASPPSLAPAPPQAMWSPSMPAAPEPEPEPEPEPAGAAAEAEPAAAVGGWLGGWVSNLVKSVSPGQGKPIQVPPAKLDAASELDAAFAAKLDAASDSDAAFAAKLVG